MSLLNKASILTTPTSYENGKILSVKPVPSLGNELIKNGDFATDSYWAKGTGWSISGGTANCDGTQTGNTNLNNSSNNGIVNNKFYKIVYTISNYVSGSIRIKAGNQGYGVYHSSNGTYTQYIKAQVSTFPYAQFNADANFIGSIDNVSVKEVLDADFDFTRNSSATRVNSQGLIEDMQILSGDLVSNGDFSQEGSEEVTNGDFATDSDWDKGTGWIISGGKAIQDGTGSGSSLQQSNILVVGKTYKITYEILEITQGSIQVFAGYPHSNVPSNNTVGVHTHYIKAEGNTNLYLYPSNFIGSIDNVSVKEVGQDWTLDGEAELTAQGARIYSSNGSYSSVRQSNDVLTIGNKYKITFNVISTNGTSLANGNSSITYDTSTTGNKTFYITASEVGLIFKRAAAITTDVTITNISVIEITDDTNLPRIDYTGGEGHWLFEPQSTNLITQSELFSDSYWTKSGSSVVSGFISPDGTSNAFKLVENTATTTHQVVRGFSYLNAKYSLSVFLKADERNWIKINLYDGTSSVYAYFDLTNGVVGQELGASGKIENYGNGWYRCSMSTTSVVSLGSGDISFRLAKFDGGTGYTGNGTSGLYIFGAQLEQQSFATSYIPTEGSIKTRLADAAFGAGSSDLINSTEGVLYAEIAALADDLSQRVISLSDGTTNERVVLSYHNSTNRIRCFIKSGGSFYATLDKVVSDTTDFHKIAYKYKSGETKLFVDGSLIASSSSTFSITGLNVLQFANGTPTASPLQGKVKSVAVFKEDLTDAELTCLTTI